MNGSHFKNKGESMKINNLDKVVKTRYQCILLMIGIAVCIWGFSQHSFNTITFGITVVFLNNVLYAVVHMKERIIFLFFHITFFTFLLARPIFGMLEGSNWWTVTEQAEENVLFSLFLITLTLVFILLGAMIASAVYKNKECNVVPKFSNNEFVKYLQAVALIVFYVTFFFVIIEEGEKLMFMRGKTYLEFYTGFQSHLPDAVHSIASFMRVCLCIYLGTFPKKKNSIIVLILFELSAIPSLLIGVRNPIMLNTIFCVLYFVIRDIKDNSQKWIGRFEKICMIVLTPIALIGMVLIRIDSRNMQFSSWNPLALIRDFFEGQGVTFEVLEICYGYRNNLPQRDDINYTFGGMIDYWYHGRVGQKLFGTEALPPGNNVINAVQGNNLSHHLSYASKQDEYFKGHGWGSSYLLENYLDWGYIGVAIFSLILGILFIVAMRWLGKKVLVNTIVLISLTTVFFIPRAEATGWLTFIVTLQFWLCVGCCYLGAYICCRWKWLQKLLLKVKLVKE